MPLSKPQPTTKLTMKQVREMTCDELFKIPDEHWAAPTRSRPRPPEIRTGVAKNRGKKYTHAWIVALNEDGHEKEYHVVKSSDGGMTIKYKHFTRRQLDTLHYKEALKTHPAILKFVMEEEVCSGWYNAERWVKCMTKRAKTWRDLPTNMNEKNRQWLIKVSVRSSANAEPVDAFALGQTKQISEDQALAMIAQHFLNLGEYAMEQWSDSAEDCLAFLVEHYSPMQASAA